MSDLMVYKFGPERDKFVTLANTFVTTDVLAVPWMVFFSHIAERLGSAAY
jgi:hypothetical protein